MGKTTKLLLSFGVLFLVAALIDAVTNISETDNLKVTFCDVGQGDATLISLKNNQILVDAGRGSAVLDCLSQNMPLTDKTIELAIATHPDIDHYGGFIDVFDHYKIISFATIPVGKETQAYQHLLNKIQKAAQSDSSFQFENLYTGDQVKLGKISVITVWPSKDWINQYSIKDSATTEKDSTSSQGVLVQTNSPAVLGMETIHKDVNDFSLVLHLQYQEFDLLINGDAQSAVQERELQTGLVPPRVEIMTMPHHGSRFGLLDKWLSVVNPQFVAISVGAHNSYGHPAPESLRKLENSKINYLRTDQQGTIRVETDGKTWWLK